MADVIDFSERSARLAALTLSAPVDADFGQVKMLGIQDAAKGRIKAALNVFLWECLSSAHPDKSFAITDDMLRDYTAEVTALPNITPNGLVLPKCENQLGFNLLQKEAIAAFNTLALGDRIARVQWPVNVRLQSGTPNPDIDSRPRASVKPHSDIWAGDPASGIMCFLAVLGDPDCSGIDFIQPTDFPKSFVRTLGDYNEGKELMQDAEHLCSFDARGWWLVDPYLLHQTTKRKPGWRISIDFRFIPRDRVPSDIDEDESRKPWFIPYGQWAGIGTKQLLIADDSMHRFIPNQSKDPYTVGYPTRIRLQETGDSDEPSTQKRTG